MMHRAYFLVVVLLLTLLSSSISVSAQTISTPSAVTVSASVDYALPYPGILPDNPLYFLKATRDRVISWLIANPVKKANFDLLQSDKRLQMGVYLVNEDESKLPLAISTMSKGQNYFSEAIGQVQRAKSQGSATGDIAQRLILSSAKHEEVLKDLSSRLPKKDQGTVNPLLSQMADLHTQALALRKK